MDAIQKAGGVTLEANHKVEVLRRLPGQEITFKKQT